MDSLSLLQAYYQRNIPSSLQSLTPPKTTTGLPAVTGGAITPTANSPLSTKSSNFGLDVSAIAIDLNGFSKSLTGNETARTGLRGLVMEIGRNGGPSQAGGVVAGLKELQTSDRSTFKSFFSAAGGVAAMGGSVTSFARTVNSLSNNNEARQSFVQAVGDIVASPGSGSVSRRELTGNTLATVNDILGKTTGQTQTDTLKNFLAGLSSAKTLDAKNTYITDFRKTNADVLTG